MKATSSDGVRRYTCKRCGKEQHEPLRDWKKKPQEYKNVCQSCLNKKAIAIKEREERAKHGAFYGKYAQYTCL